MKNLRTVKILLFLLLGFAFLPACNESKELDNQTAGNIKISVDETYKPVMEEQLKIFLSRFPNAKIQASYKPEMDCIQDYLMDSARVIFVTRELTQDEIQFALSKQIVSKSMAMARDAVVFITSKKYEEPKFTLKEIKEMLTGKNSSFQIVFDHKNSSTVRYINDSLIPGQKLSENIFAANNCEEVIDYVAKSDNTIGVIGVSWVADASDSLTENFLSKINVAAIKPDTGIYQNYVMPYQAYIGLREYPCTRNFYFISKETWQGLGTGLVNYLCRDGQLVFKQAKMFPLRVNVLLRETNVKE